VVFMETKGTKFSEMWRQDGSWCWAPTCKNDDKKDNSPNKYDLGQPYKLTNQVELWTHMWPPILCWTCLHLAIARNYVWSH
jgi:hypothetical protein